MCECKCFRPEISINSKVLILGSMPGVRSIEMQQYYAHPQNRFYRVLGMLIGVYNLHSLEYYKKIEILLNKGYALWDVIEKCKRLGSLDTEVKNDIPNDIKNLLNQYPNIKKICLNGTKAYNIFEKYYSDLILDKSVEIIKLPSTSSSNAKFNINKLIEKWEQILL